MSEDILVTCGADGIAHVLLNRPTKRNAISLAMWHEMREIFLGLNADKQVRSVILSGAGGHFCAGADLSEFATVRANVELGKAYEAAEFACLQAILDCGKPTICQIEGYAIGGGCSVALSCDFRIADKGATFFIPAGKLGIVYSQIECELLLRQVGLANAKIILFAGERMTAAEACGYRLIDTVAESDVATAARAFASRFGNSGPISIAGHKFILNTLVAGEGVTRVEEIDHWVHLSMASEDYKEGQLAFREKRAPSFKGV